MVDVGHQFVTSTTLVRTTLALARSGVVRVRTPVPSKQTARSALLVLLNYYECGRVVGAEGEIPDLMFCLVLIAQVFRV